MRKKFWWLVAAIVIFAAGFLSGANKFAKPKTVIHVVTVKWKPDATQDQIKRAMDCVERLAASYPGIRNIWLRSIKVQSPEAGMTHAFVMEFESEEALKNYSGSQAQKEWYKVYLPVRDESRTHDITN
jgi:hypothetical protein